MYPRALCSCRYWLQHSTTQKRPLLVVSVEACSLSLTAQRMIHQNPNRPYGPATSPSTHRDGIITHFLIASYILPIFSRLSVTAGVAALLNSSSHSEMAAIRIGCRGLLELDTDVAINQTCTASFKSVLTNQSIGMSFTSCNYAVMPHKHIL